MKKILIGLLVMALCVGLMAGCGDTQTPTDPTNAPVLTEPTTPNLTSPDTQPVETRPVETQPVETVPQEVALGHEDTYWVAYEYFGLMDGQPQPVEEESWFLDLTVWVNGTARFRDIHEGVCLMDDSYLDLTWERTQEGEYLFYCVLYPEPVLRGTCNDGILTLEYFETVLSLKQASMPDAPGQIYSPAELAGTWLLVSGETEGWEYEAMPGELSSLVFSVTSYDGPLVLSADMIDRDSYGNPTYSGYGQPIEVLQEPLYEGCENDSWSVRIGEPSPKDTNGFPTETEYYATMVDENKLILQRYFTLDGYPAVSHQTYLRPTNLVSWMSYESMDLELSNWVCTGYEDFSGEELPLPAELEGLSVILGENGVCHIRYGDAAVGNGTWMLDKGGVLLLCGNEELEDPFWFGGTVTGYYIQTGDDSLETYQMALYYNGGILRLSLKSYG